MPFIIEVQNRSNVTGIIHTDYYCKTMRGLEMLTSLRSSALRFDDYGQARIVCDQIKDKFDGVVAYTVVEVDI